MPSDPIKRLAEISGHIHILRAEARVLINQLGEHLAACGRTVDSAFPRPGAGV